MPWGDDESLHAYLREQEGDVLITGNTGIPKVSGIEKKYIINPGTATGGFNGLEKYKYKNHSRQPIPSFIILEFKQHSLVAFIYTLQQGEVKIDK